MREAHGGAEAEARRQARMAPKSRNYRDGGIIPRAATTRASCVFMRSSGAGKGHGEASECCHKGERYVLDRISPRFDLDASGSNVIDGKR